MKILSKRMVSGITPVVFGLAVIMAAMAGCGGSGDSGRRVNPHVAITPLAAYFKVEIDYSFGDYFDIGREYGLKTLAFAPDYELNADSYLKDLVESTDPVGLPGAGEAGGNVTYLMMIDRANEIKKQIAPDYVRELDGFASVLSGGDEDVLGDGKLSVNEYLILNLTPDIATDVACSAAAVYGDRSVTGQTLVGRITDWFPGKKGQMGYLNAVIHSRTGAREVVSFGWLGVTGVLVGLNSDGVFLANLYSPLGAPYSAEGRRSILLDMRQALESYSNIEDVAGFLGDPAKLYGYNHNMFLADKNTAMVLENDFFRSRDLRAEDSELNPGIEWGLPNALACVNSFVLLGNDDNHTGVNFNKDRWASFSDQITARGRTMDFDGMKSVVAYHKPGAGGTDTGDIYGATSVQALVYSYADNRLELWLHPFSGDFIDQPELVEVPMPFQP